MKKQILILITGLFILTTSCNSDDDNDVITDPFVGSWKLIQRFQNEVLQQNTVCGLELTIRASEDGVMEIDFFGEGGNSECVLLATRQETWMNLGDGNYEITLAGETIVEEFVFTGDLLSISFIEITEGVEVQHRDVYVMF